MSKYIYITATLLLISVNIAAQPQYQRVRDGFEQVEAERIAFITRYLELTSDEAKKFWPVYDDFRNRRELISRERQEISISFRQNYRNLGDKEAGEMADRYIALKVRETALAEEYHNKFKSVIPPAKVMRLYEAENIFRMQLLRRVRGGGHGRGPGGPPGQNRE